MYPKCCRKYSNSVHFQQRTFMPQYKAQWKPKCDLRETSYRLCVIYKYISLRYQTKCQRRDDIDGETLVDGDIGFHERRIGALSPHWLRTSCKRPTDLKSATIQIWWKKGKKACSTWQKKTFSRIICKNTGTFVMVCSWKKKHNNVLSDGWISIIRPGNSQHPRIKELKALQVMPHCTLSGY